jgi:hypothetical protein
MPGLMVVTIPFSKIQMRSNISMKSRPELAVTVEHNVRRNIPTNASRGNNEIFLVDKSRA